MNRYQILQYKKIMHNVKKKKLKCWQLLNIIKKKKKKIKDT